MTKPDAQKMVLDLTSSGMTLRGIANAIGVAQPTVSRWRNGCDGWGRNLNRLREFYNEQFPGDEAEQATVGLFDRVEVDWSLPPDFPRWSKHAALRAIPVSDDSMEPTLPRGAVVFVDTKQTSPSTADLYAVDFGDGLTVKWIEMVPRRKVARIVSDNSRYAVHEVPPGDLAIHGRVVAWFQWRAEA